METTNNLKKELAHFTGTEKYYCYYQLLLTDGTHYLAQEAQCFWLIDAIWSHVITKQWLGKEDFITCTLCVADTVGALTFDDGNGNILASQHIPFTDFPLDEIQLFIVRGEDRYVVMFPSEY